MIPHPPESSIKYTPGISEMAHAQYSRIQAFKCNKTLQKKEHGGVAGNRTNARSQRQVRAFEGFKANRYILMKVPAA